MNMDSRAFALIDANNARRESEQIVCDVASLQRVFDTVNTDIRRLEAERDRETELRRKAERHVADMQNYMERIPYSDEWETLLRERTEMLDSLRGADAHAADLGCTCNMHGDPDPCPACSVRSYTNTSRWTG